MHDIRFDSADNSAVDGARINSISALCKDVLFGGTFKVE